MSGLLLSLVRASLSAAYWFGCLYVAVGLFAGDHVVADRIVAQTPVIPPWLFALAALAIYACLSFAWDRVIASRRVE